MTTAGYGSDLYSAFSPLNNDQPQDFIANDNQSQNKEKQKEYDINEDINDNTSNNANINKQMIQEQKLMSILNEIKKQKNYSKQSVPETEPSYIDKLFSKKKELIKLLQFSLIVILALSVHGIVDYYLKEFIEKNDFSDSRVFIIRLLYPLSILFLLWNLKIFIK